MLSVACKVHVFRCEKTGGFYSTPAEDKLGNARHKFNFFFSFWKLKKKTQITCKFLKRWLNASFQIVQVQMNVSIFGI